ncbi:hypothetical protein Tco_0175564 [Tanacetum coccineum]
MKEERWNDPVIPEGESINYENPDLEQLLGVMEYKVGMLIEKAISLMGMSESIFGMSSNIMRNYPGENLVFDEPEPQPHPSFPSLEVDLGKEKTLNHPSNHLVIFDEKKLGNS